MGERIGVVNTKNQVEKFAKKLGQVMERVMVEEAGDCAGLPAKVLCHLLQGFNKELTFTLEQCEDLQHELTVCLNDKIKTKKQAKKSKKI